MEDAIRESHEGGHCCVPWSAPVFMSSAPRMTDITQKEAKVRPEGSVRSCWFDFWGRNMSLHELRALFRAGMPRGTLKRKRFRRTRQHGQHLPNPRFHRKIRPCTESGGHVSNSSCAGSCLKINTMERAAICISCGFAAPFMVEEYSFSST